jgi:uncharacterized protein YjbI with pentapeptide repeats
VLGRLEPGRKTALIQFLVEAELIQRVEGRGPIISLSGAALSGLGNIALSGVTDTLSEFDPSQAHLSFGADLRGADLSDAYLHKADLSNADLSDANLRNAFLYKADLSDADLSDVDLSYEADLRGADLSNADLSDADLRYANLRGAKGISNQKLNRQAKTLEGASMPTGQTYEDWLKSKDRESDGQNSGTS